MATTYDTIYFKRGLDADLPALAAQGEPLWTTDTHRVFVGTGDDKQELVSTSVAQTLTNKTLTAPTVSTPKITTIQTFADNTAAAALPTGTVYRTSTGVLMVKY